MVDGDRVESAGRHARADEGESTASDTDGWLPFAPSDDAASDDAVSDGDRTAGLAAMILAAAIVALCGVGGLLTILSPGDEGAPNAEAAARTSAPAVTSPQPTPSRASVTPSASPRATPTPGATPTRAAAPTRAARPALSRPATPVRNRRAPLTIQEVFGGSDRVTVQGREYRLVYTDATSDCASGARGDTAAELRRSGCTQLIRAVAVDEAGRRAVTVGVANLPDAAGAGRVVASARGRGGFTAMWSGQGRQGRRGGGDDYRETGAVGRFVVYGIGTGERGVAQAVADLRGVVAGRLYGRG